MKKLLAYFLIAFISIGSFGHSLFAASNTNRFQSTAEKTVTKYITRLEDGGYSNSEIITSLTKLKNLYDQKKLLSNYRGNRKLQIDALISSISNAIIKLQEEDDSDLLDIFNQNPPKSTDQTSTTILPPVVKPNYITGVSPSIVNGSLRAELLTGNMSSFYREYDVFLYTPTTNLQPGPGNFIPKPENLIYSYYNNYTITTNFQSETNIDLVKGIRNLAESGDKTGATGLYSFKFTRSVSKDGYVQFFGPLSDREFAQKAKTNNYGSTNVSTAGDYETYFLYIAKDNSEAFTLTFHQSGKKVMN